MQSHSRLSSVTGNWGKVNWLKKTIFALTILGLLGSGYLAVGAAIAFAEGAQHSTADVVPMRTGVCDGRVCRTAQLVRNANGVSFTIDTSYLDNQHAFTVWMLIDDFGTTDTATGGYEIAHRVAGGISQKDWDGHFAGHLSAGELPPVTGGPPEITMGPYYRANARYDKFGRWRL